MIKEEMEMFEISIAEDFHHHLRDEPVLKDVVIHAANNFGRILVMPNLVPPVRNINDAVAYRNRIISNLPEGSRLELLMTLYFTNETSPDDIQQAYDSGIVNAVKLYPANVTTNSQHGVTSIENIKPSLSKMASLGMPLLVHGEVNDPTVDIFDREKIFIETILRPIRMEIPDLKIVMEHITTSDAVEFVNSYPNTAATITIHHLLYNRNDIFAGNKIHPHLYCLPILKSESHRQALVSAALSGSPKYFFGTDSAPHSIATKECADGCAGVFSSPVAVPLLVEFFERHSSLHLLEDFLSHNGANFYGIPLLNRRMKLKKESWSVPMVYNFGEGNVKPLCAGKELHWKVDLDDC